LLGFLNYRFDIIFLKIFSTPAQIGFYSTATFMAETLWFIPGAVSLVLYSKLVTGERSGNITSGVLKYAFLSVVFTAIVLLVIAKPLIRFFYTDSFLPAFSPFIILLPGVIMLTIPKILSSHFAAVLEKPEITLKGRAIAVVFNIVLNILLIPRYGMYGAAFASSFAYTIESIFILVIFKKQNMLKKYKY